MRKPDPERIYLAHRVATFRRLVDADRLDELDAEHWLSAWERQAEGRGLARHSGDFWRDGQAWIAGQRDADGGWCTQAPGARRRGQTVTSTASLQSFEGPSGGGAQTVSPAV